MRRKKKYDIETFFIDRVLNKEHFYEKSCRKYAPNGSPRPFFYSGKQLKTAIACKKFFEEKYILKEDYQKPLKNFSLIFLSSPVPFNGQSNKKTKGAWN